jgi:hypothetical protein
VVKVSKKKSKMTTHPSSATSDEDSFSHDDEAKEPKATRTAPESDPEFHPESDPGSDPESDEENEQEEEANQESDQESDKIKVVYLDSSVTGPSRY